MPNYQNNMRYGRQGNMRQPYGTGCGMPRTMSQADARRGASGPAARTDNRQRREESCCSPDPRSENGCCAARESAERREERRDRENPRSCGCRREDPLYGMPLAMAYVPWQTWGEIFDICEGFQTGTVFEELDKPFLGRGGWKQ